MSRARWRRATASTSGRFTARSGGRDCARDVPVIRLCAQPGVAGRVAGAGCRAGLVMTIIGAFLTAMVVAREWERGTLEALFVTPMRAGEFLISKFLPYFGLGMIGFALCLLAGQFLFHVPLRGSLALLCLASMIYLLVALGIGLLVSTLVKSQFLASQLAMLLTFLPAMMLSGFLYDIRSMPAA